jgi:hypothetical protein
VEGIPVLGLQGKLEKNTSLIVLLRKSREGQARYFGEASLEVKAKG